MTVTKQTVLRLRVSRMKIRGRGGEREKNMVVVNAVEAVRVKEQPVQVKAAGMFAVTMSIKAGIEQIPNPLTFSFFWVLANSNTQIQLCDVTKQN